MMDWKTLKDKIDAAVEETLLAPDQDVVDVYKYSISKGGAGVPQDNQMLTTWFYGGADVTYIADWCYFLIELAGDESYSIEELRTMARFWFLQPSHFGNYCGMERQYQFSKQIGSLLDSMDRDAFVQVLDSYRAYIMNINVWIYHYMRWGASFALPRKDRAYYEAAMALL